MSNKGNAVAEVVSRWCQCENAGCSKWRRLPPGTKVDDSQPWFCYMNPDELRNSCEAPEESYNEDVEEDAAGMTDDEASEPATRASSMPGRPGSGRGRGRKRGGRGRVRGRGRGRASKADTASSPPWPCGGKRPRVKEEQIADAFQGTKKRRTMSLSHDELDAELDRYSMEPASGLLHSQQPKQGEVPPQPNFAAPLARGTAKARKAHKGFEKLLSAAGMWEVAKGKGRAVLVPPQWIWEGFAQFAPDAAEVACTALDMLSAARYFEMGGASTATAKPSVDEVQSSARLAVMLASAAAADSAAGSLAASVAPAMPAASSQQLTAPRPAASPVLTATAQSASQSPVMPPGTQASVPARTPLPPTSWSPLAFPPTGTPPPGQQSSSVSPQLPIGLSSNALGPRSPAAPSIGDPMAGAVAPPPQSAAGTPPNPPSLSSQLPQLQAAAQTGPVLPQPSGPHSGVHWRPLVDPQQTAPEPHQPFPALSQPSVQQTAGSGQAVPGSAGGVPLPQQSQGSAAQGVTAGAAAAIQSLIMPSVSPVAVSNGSSEHVNSIAAREVQSLQANSNPQTDLPSKALDADMCHASHAVSAYANGTEAMAQVPNGLT